MDTPTPATPNEQTDAAQSAAANPPARQPDTPEARDSAEPAAAAKVTSALGEGDLPDLKDAAAPADWPKDWRESLAEDDDKTLSMLKRYNSPKELVKANVALRQKMSERAQKPELPENATDEQLAEYREQVGVPKSAEEYDLTLSEGLTIGEEDKGHLNEFLKYAHEDNMSQEEVTKSLNSYYKIVADQGARQLTSDQEFKDGMEDTLRAEWGEEYRTNHNLVNNYLKTVPEVAEALSYARDADGKLVGNNPDVIRWIAGLARTNNMPITQIPNGVNAQQHMQTRKAEIETMMKKDSNAYYASETIQKEYRSILEAEEAQKKAGA